jgi:hypothetical protein
LAGWVAAQRYLKDNLSVERKRRLEERGFAALLKFKRREGHCRVPIYYGEGKFKLGLWVSTQRRKKKVMSFKRRARLNRMGFVWKADKGGRAHRDYKRKTGHEAGGH